MISMLLSPEVYACILPKEPVSTVKWLTANLRMTDDSKTKGYFDVDDFPHVEEILECFDDPKIRRITFQTASQIGKTMLSQGCLAKVAACDPHPMAFADADEKSTRRVLTRTWKLFDKCEQLQPICPPPHLRASDHMQLKTCLVHGAWAGSPASAADYGAYIVILNECDKMKQKSTDKEADFRELMGERTKGYEGAKVLEISTPTIKGDSYIEAQRFKGDNRARMVPCPHCNHFQELFIKDGKEPGGVRWQRLRNGKHDAEKARETAYIQCEKCEKKIQEEHRRGMLQAGLWVPEGCRIQQGKLTGKPIRPGGHASFGPLSTLHSLLPGITIGHIAEEKVRALTDPVRRAEKNRNIVNSWDGKTYENRPRTVRPNQIIHRMGTDLPLRVVPEWANFLTAAADVGAVGEELIFYWAVCAWGMHSRGHLVDLGVAWSLDEMRKTIADSNYETASTPSEQPVIMRPVQWGIDSGSFTNRIYDFCLPIPNCWPVKGSSRDGDRDFDEGSFIEMYSPGIQRSGLPTKLVQLKLKMGTYDLIRPNTQRSQEWLEDRLSGSIKPDHENWFSLPGEALEGGLLGEIDLIHHLLGDYRDEKGRWKKVYEDQDFRDAIRYAMVMAWHYTMNGSRWNQLAPRKQINTQNQANQQKHRRRQAPDDAFLISQR
ncbi:phage terminase large subunit family protein [bacterium]|nr:phage terminase large subunit family protein [bacterium]